MSLRPSLILKNIISLEKMFFAVFTDNKEKTAENNNWEDVYRLINKLKIISKELLKKYNYCNKCMLARTIAFWDKQPPDKNIWGKKRKKFKRKQ